jgi:hypothetical protein
MSHGRIRKLFSDKLLEYVTSTDSPKPLSYSFDNIKKNGPESADYIEAHIIPSDTFSDTLGGDHTAFIGMYQMTIVVQYNTGYVKVEKIVEHLQNAFKINKVFTDASGFSVQVISPIKTAEGKQSGIQWRVPCYFEYRSDTN